MNELNAYILHALVGTQARTLAGKVKDIVSFQPI